MPCSLSRPLQTFFPVLLSFPGSGSLCKWRDALLGTLPGREEIRSSSLRRTAELEEYSPRTPPCRITKPAIVE